MKKFKSLRQHIWLYFMIFTILILIVLWLFLFVFFDSFYRYTKIKQVNNAAQTITESFETNSFGEYIQELAYTNDMSIEITDKYGFSIYSYEMMGGNSLLNSNYGARLFGWRESLLESQEDEFNVILQEDKYNTQMYVYGMILGERTDIKAFVYLNCSLEPIRATSIIIRQQFYFITVFILLLALIITVFISKMISKPIVKITKSAEKFAKGDYSVKFEGGKYSEAQQLASVLNYAGEEISKVDGLRRDLISNVSHDLRTPLTIIKAYAEMIRDLSGENPAKRQQHVNVIIDEADRLSGLVNGLLELSKLESGNVSLEISEFSINEKINEILNRYKIFEERDGYKIIYENDDDVTVNADVAKIEQVLYNFINNAINYTGDDKTVIIKQTNKPTSVRIEIIDTGEGIPQDKLPLIFDRYYRDEKHEREVVGTGLGLSIIKEILKMHEFPFGVQSEVGKGSTFWFEIKT